MRTLIFLLVILTVSVADGQIIVRQQEGPAVSPLPQVVQEMNDEQYQTWAKWHNTLAKQHAKEFNASTTHYHRGWVTTHTSNRQAFQGHSSTNTSGISTTRGTLWAVPGQIKGVFYFNPFCKAKTAPTPVLEDGSLRPAAHLQPDWDNIFAVYRGNIMSVNEIAQDLPTPVFKEALYRKLLQLPAAQ